MHRKGGISVPNALINLALILAGLIVLILMYHTYVAAGNTVFGPIDSLVKWHDCWLEWGSLCTRTTGIN